jgi:hypothetical protein
MRILTAILASILLTASTYAADKALTEEQIEGVQQAIKGMGAGCTVEDTEIEAENGTYEADDVICDDGRYDVYLDKDYKVTNKVKED